MRLTKQTGHAIRILTDCAQAEGQLIKVADISNRLEITKQNVFKIVHILSHAGFVAAVRGPNGGVKLARPASAIRIGDVVRAIEITDVEIAGEAQSGTNTNQKPGSISTVFDDAMTAFVSVLDQHTLADLAVSRRTASRSTTTSAKAPDKEEIATTSVRRTAKARRI